MLMLTRRIRLGLPTALFTTFTGQEGVHIQHEEGLKFRLKRIGGTNYQVKDAFVYHFPNICRDKVPSYGYILNKGLAHYPLKCKKCSTQKEGKTLSPQELDQAKNLGEWFCENCR